MALLAKLQGLKVISFKPLRSGTLVAFCSVTEMHLRILDLSVHEKNESRMGWPAGQAAGHPRGHRAAR